MSTILEDAAQKVTLAKGVEGHSMTLLGEDFFPSDLDVICGRGRRIFESIGNKRFRQLVAMHLDEYKAAGSKVDKTQVIAKIVALVRQNSPTGGGFVKKSDDENRWYEVGDFLAREKTSQAFRDILHEKYSSSNEAKKRKRNSRSNLHESLSSPNFTSPSSNMNNASSMAFLQNAVAAAAAAEPPKNENPLFAALQKNKRQQVSHLSAPSLRTYGTANASYFGTPNMTAGGLGEVGADAHNFEWGNAATKSMAAPKLFANVLGGSGGSATNLFFQKKTLGNNNNGITTNNNKLSSSTAVSSSTTSATSASTADFDSGPIHMSSMDFGGEDDPLYSLLQDCVGDDDYVSQEPLDCNKPQRKGAEAADLEMLFNFLGDIKTEGDPFEPAHLM